MFDIMGCLDGATASATTVPNFQNPTVTGINNIFWKFKFVGLFSRTVTKLRGPTVTRINNYRT